MITVSGDNTSAPKIADRFKIPTAIQPSGETLCIGDPGGEGAVSIPTPRRRGFPSFLSTKAVLGTVRSLGHLPVIHYTDLYSSTFCLNVGKFRSEFLDQQNV